MFLVVDERILERILGVGVDEMTSEQAKSRCGTGNNWREQKNDKLARCTNH